MTIQSFGPLISCLIRVIYERSNWQNAEFEYSDQDKARTGRVQKNWNDYSWWQSAQYFILLLSRSSQERFLLIIRSFRVTFTLVFSLIMWKLTNEKSVFIFWIEKLFKLSWISWQPASVSTKTPSSFIVLTFNWRLLQPLKNL